MKRIPAVVIQTPNSERFLPLIEILKHSKFFEPVLMAATMGVNLSETKQSFEKQELTRYGRVLSRNERACAISHTRAREIIAESENGGLILEDDARIPDLKILESVSRAFLEEKAKSRSALGLLDYSGTTDSSKRQGNHLNYGRFHRLFAEVPLAVGTLLTPEAAAGLVMSAGEYSQLADWPYSRCRYYFLSTGCIAHGDSTTNSVIGDPSIRVFGRSQKIFTIKGIKHLSKRILQKIDTYLISYHQSR